MQKVFFPLYTNCWPITFSAYSGYRVYHVITTLINDFSCRSLVGWIKLNSFQYICSWLERNHPVNSNDCKENNRSRISPRSCYLKTEIYSSFENSVLMVRVRCVSVVHKAMNIPRWRMPQKRLRRLGMVGPCSINEAKQNFCGIHSLVCCYLDVVGEPQWACSLCQRGLMLLVGLTKPERLQWWGQTKRSTWS